MRPTVFLAALLAVSLLPAAALAADLSVGVVSSSLKVRPTDTPATTPGASIKAARNEFEAFQIVLTAGASDVSGIGAKLSASLAGPGGAKIPDADVTLYAERYYDVATPSNDEGATGLWPDALVPDVDTYFGEKRNAFPMTVAAGDTGVIWVDVLVPQQQTPGDYAGSIEVDVGGAAQATVPVSLHVGSFALPSTPTLHSAFGMGWATEAQVHCGGGSFPFCATEDAANAIRALYLRAGLDHRITISNTDFQPPFGSSEAPYEKYVLPLVQGTGPTRLPGAQLTTVVLDGSNSTVGPWISYAQQKGFFDKLFYYPVDEPGTSSSTWSTFSSDSSALHSADPNAQICLTTSMQSAQQFSAQDQIDIFVPVLDEMYGTPDGNWGPAGDQRSLYDAWLAANPARKLWMYQSCDQHGCGACGVTNHGADFTGWPERVIDSTAVQDRAFPWIAFQERVSAELYYAVDAQLPTAWQSGGQCAFAGSGDGTLFYPGLAGVVGGADDIPIESIRLEMIREGMEDYEYLTMVARTNPALADSVAKGLFPTPYECHQPPAALEAARDQLFAALDTGASQGDAGAPPAADGGSPVPKGGEAGVPPASQGEAGTVEQPDAAAQDDGGSWAMQPGSGGASAGCSIAAAGAAGGGAGAASRGLALVLGYALLRAARRRAQVQADRGLPGARARDRRAS